MLLPCPHCATVFRVDAELFSQGDQNVRCSICRHIWVASMVPLPVDQSLVLADAAAVAVSKLPAISPLSTACDRLKNMLNMCLVAMLAASLSGGMIMNRGTITAYWPFLINGFDAQVENSFFVQLAVEVGREAHVTVTPLANRFAR